MNVVRGTPALIIKSFLLANKSEIWLKGNTSDTQALLDCMCLTLRRLYVLTTVPVEFNSLQLLFLLL